MITISLNGSDERVARYLRTRTPQIVEAIKLRANALMIQLQAHIVGEKLSGQVLQHRTGKLAGSVRVIEPVEDGTSVVAGVQAGGGPAFYGRFHEFGTSSSYQIVPVNKKALAFMMGGKQVIVRSVLHPPVKERSFMRSSLNDMSAQIIAELREAISAAGSVN